MALYVTMPAAHAQSTTSSEAILRYDIPAGPLPSALNAWSAQTKKQVVFAPDLVSGKQTRGAMGQYSVEQALTQLLAGTGLVWKRVNAQTYALERAPSPPRANANKKQPSKLKTITLNAILIRGSRVIKDVTGGALGTVSKLNLPFSVVAVPSGEIQDKQPFSLYGVFVNDASVSRQTGSDYSSWSSYIDVRGVAVSSTDGSQKIDGIPASTWGLSLPMEFMDQVQLLKGASGFMYGFATPGGAVNYVTKKPPENGSLFNVDVGDDSNSVLHEHVDIGRAADDGSGLGYRLNVTHESGTTSTGTGVSRNAAALAFRANFATNLQWSFTSLYQKSGFTRPQPMIFVISYPSAVLPNPVGVIPNPSGNGSYSNSSLGYLASSIKWDMSPNWNAVFTLAHSESYINYSQDYLNLMNEAGEYQDRVFDSTEENQNNVAQILVGGHVDVFGMRNHVVLGATVIRNSIRDGIGSDYQGYVLYGYRNLYTPSAFSYVPDYGSGQATFPTSTDKQAAAFVSDTVDLTDKWRALLGLRFTHYTQTQDNYNFISATSYTLATTNFADDMATPSIGLMYKPSIDSIAYASYAEAMEAGTTAGNNFANFGQLLPPLKSKQWEIGYKTEGLRVQSSIALFRLDRAVGYGNAQNVYVENGIGRYQGLDASLNVNVTHNLSAGASGLYLQKANYLNASVGSEWLIGKPVPGGYRKSAALNVKYRVPAVGLAFSVDARYNGNGIVREIPAEQLLITIPGDVLYDFYAKYAQLIGNQVMIYRFGIHNVSNKSYWINGTGSNVFLGDPRTYFLNVSFEL